MTPQEALDTFGNSISCQYYTNNGDYQTAAFTYNSVWSYAYGDHSNGSWTYEGTQFLEYTCNVEPNVNPQYITFDIQPLYSIFDTEQIHTVICLSTGSQNSISMIYQSPSWDWVFDGVNYHLENSSEGDISGQYSYIRSQGQGFTFVPADFTSTRLASGYSYRAVFSGNIANYPCRLLIGIPYVSTGASGSEGTFTTASSGGDTNITVNVDMSETNEKIDETNGLIGSILSWIGNFFVNLGNTVKGWFVPSQDFITNWVHRLIDIIEDKFAPWPVADQTIKDIVQRLLTALGEGGVQSVDFPSITIPGVPDGPFIQGRSVSLTGDGAWADLIEIFRDFVDVVCTIWVINMVCHRVKGMLVGEAVVEVEGSD